jgi:hypothetical protein
VTGNGSRGHGARGCLRAAAGPSGGSWSHEARGGFEAALCQETGAVRHAGMCIRLAFHLELELVCGDIRSSGYRQ